MTHQEIKELAGDRPVPPWIMKLVNAAVAKEREECAKIAEQWIRAYLHPSEVITKAIRARVEQQRCDKS